MAQINCVVQSCRHNSQGQVCSLSNISVGNSTSSPHCCADTECDSFEE